MYKQGQVCFSHVRLYSFLKKYYFQTFFKQLARMQGALDLDSCRSLEYGTYLSTETRHLEFKASGGYRLVKNFPAFVKKYGCAFSNTEGGAILFGVNDNGVVVGRSFDKHTEDELREVVDEIVKFQFNPPLSHEQYTLRFLTVTCPAGTPQIRDLKVIYLHFSAPKPFSTTIHQVNEWEVYLRREASIWGPLTTCEVEELKRQKKALFANHVNQQRRNVVEAGTVRRLKTKPGFVRFTITGLGETRHLDKSRDPQNTDKRSRTPQCDSPLQRTTDCQDISNRPLNTCQIQEVQKEEDAISTNHINKQQRDVTEVATAGRVTTKTGFVRITITGPSETPNTNKRKDPQNTVKRSRSPQRDSPVQRTMGCQDISDRPFLYFGERIKDTETLKSVSYCTDDPNKVFCGNIVIHGANFMSNQGGTLLFGVIDGRVHGFEVYHKDEDIIRLMVDNTMNRFEPPIFPHNYTLHFLAVHHETENNLKVVRLNFQVPPSRQHAIYQVMHTKGRKHMPI